MAPSWGPPRRARFHHWLTAAALTPKASAMCRWGQPFCRRGQACKRRASFPWCGVGCMPGRVAHNHRLVQAFMLCSADAGLLGR
jgi:hypothetical protein